MSQTVKKAHRHIIYFKKIFFSSKYHHVVPIFHFLLLTFLFCFNFLYLYYEEPEWYEKYHRLLIERVNLVISFLSYFGAFISLVVDKNYLNRIERLIEILKIFGLNVNMKYCYVVLFRFGIVLLLMISEIIFYSSQNGIYSTIDIITNYWMLLTITMAQCEFISYMVYLRFLFEYLSQKVEDCLVSFPFDGGFRRSYIIFDVYHSLLRITEEINSDYTTVTIANFVLVFVLSISSLYMCITYVIESFNDFYLGYVYVTVALFAIRIVEAFTMVNAVEKLAEKVKGFNYKVFSMIMDDEHEIFSKDKHFLNQILLDEDLKLTSGDIFQLNYPLILSIVAGLSTFLVILIQTDQTFNKESINNSSYHF